MSIRDCLAFILFALILPCVVVAFMGHKLPMLILFAAVWMLILSDRKEKTR